MAEILIFVDLIVLNFESTCDLTDVKASVYDTKTAARHFEIIYDILRSLGLAQFLLKGQNAAIGWQKTKKKTFFLFTPAR